MIYCSKCGKSIPADSKFCVFCGAAVPAIITDKAAPQASRSRPYTFADHRKDFIRSAGFWGSLLVLAGFFLPWLYRTTGSTGLGLATHGVKVANYILLIFPICALFILIDSLTNFLPSGAAILFKVLPILLLGTIVVLILMGDKQHAINVSKLNFTNFENLVKNTGIGMWLTVIGSFIMLGHKKYKRH
jgi:hypothetical protein